MCNLSTITQATQAQPLHNMINLNVDQAIKAIATASHALILMCTTYIKTHDSELRGQEEAAYTTTESVT